jgi:beta-N-acetylhexosaminidase
MKRKGQWTLAIVLVAAVAACQSNPPAITASPSEPPTPSFPDVESTTVVPASPTGDCVTDTLKSMSLAEQVGQTLMIGTTVNSPDALDDTVKQYHLGGVFLQGRSTHTAAQLRSGIADLQKQAETPLLISLDQEGGSVQTLKGPDFPIIPSAFKLGAGPQATLKSTVSDSAKRLHGIGVSLNLAPVADTVPTSVGEENPPIGAFKREYGSDPAKVAAAIKTVVPASQDAGVLTMLKHFPGLGRVRANTDTSTNAVDSTATTTDPYLRPFADGIKAGSAGVMISSASYPKLDDSSIAAFSKPIITDLLRKKLKFTGLVMSDDLGAADAASIVAPGERAVRFLAAGGDMVLTIRGSDAAPMTASVLAKAENDKSFRARVSDAAHHVLEAKKTAGVLKCG